jgi:hypothetical protein
MSISERLSEVMPTPSSVLADEVSGVMTGVTPAGSSEPSVPSRSATSCRLRNRSDLLVEDDGHHRQAGDRLRPQLA